VLLPAGRGGFSVSIRPTRSNGQAVADGYAVIADPVRPGNTGGRFFGTNASRTIYEHNETFEAVMPEQGAPGVGAELRR